MVNKAEQNIKIGMYLYQRLPLLTFVKKSIYKVNPNNGGGNKKTVSYVSMEE